MSAPLREQKAALRKELLERRGALQDREEKNQALLRQLLALPLYREARRVFLYVSTPREPDTRGLLRDALKAGKEVFAPVCAPLGTRMTFFRVTSEEDLHPGRFGIWEPDPAVCAPAGGAFAGDSAEEGPALCVVPGVAFDRRGMRLGYGKGYYDRFLAEYGMIAVGLCYRELLLPELPAEEHDRRVRLVVTEDGCTACRRNRPRPGKEEAYE